MERQVINISGKYIVGLGVNTNYSQEVDLVTSRIIGTVGEFFSENIADSIPNRRNPGTVIALYTNYASDYRGAYSYLIGEETSSFKDLPDNLHSEFIPPGQYVKFTTPPGKRRDVVHNAWQEIYKMSHKRLGGIRHYHTDFEVYDQRASDPDNAIVDIFLSVLLDHP